MRPSSDSLSIQPSLMSVQSIQAGVGGRPGGPGSSVIHLRPHPCVSPSPCSSLLKYHLLLEAFLSDLSYLPHPQSFLKGKHSVLYSGTCLTMSPPPCGSWRKAWPKGHQRLWFSSGNSGNLCSPRQTPSRGQWSMQAPNPPLTELQAHAPSSIPRLPNCGIGAIWGQIILCW